MSLRQASSTGASSVVPPLPVCDISVNPRPAYRRHAFPSGVYTQCASGQYLCVAQKGRRPCPASRRRCSVSQGPHLDAPLACISARPPLAFQPIAESHLGAQCLSVPQAFVSVRYVSAHPRLCIASWRVPGCPRRFVVCLAFQGRMSHVVPGVLLATFSCAVLARPHPSSCPRRPLHSRTVSHAWRPVFFLEAFRACFLVRPRQRLACGVLRFPC